MLANYFFLAIRNIIKHRLIAFINILGLSIGISACLLLFLIVKVDLGFENFNRDRHRTYRIYSQFSGNRDGLSRGVPTAFSTTVREQFTGIDAVANFHNYGVKAKVTDNAGETTIFPSGKIIITHPDYFRVFDYYQWVEGDAETALRTPLKTVLTESRARAYFGDIPLSEVLGREIVYQDSLVTVVAGIVKDVNGKTDLDFTDFISLSTIESSWLVKTYPQDNWTTANNSSQLFIKLHPETPVAMVEQQLTTLAERSKREASLTGDLITPHLQQLTDLHYNSQLGIFPNSRPVTDKEVLKWLSIVAILLLVIAIINFVNLETAQAHRRLKEVGMRKILGSTRSGLINQFLLESFLLTTCGIFMSTIISFTCIQILPGLFPPGISMNFSDPALAAFLLSVLIVVGLAAGGYPAFVLSAGRPLDALRKSLTFRNNTARSTSVRSFLILFQFSAAQLLIVVTLTVTFQMKYMLNKDLGFSTDNIVNIEAPWKQGHKISALKNKFQSISEIEMMSLQGEPPSDGAMLLEGFQFLNGPNVHTFLGFIKNGETSYLSLYGLKLLAGRTISPTDTVREMMVNETFVRKMGYTNPHDAVGKIVHDIPIVGVVSDYHTRSLHHALDAGVLINSPKQFYSIGVRLRGATTAELKSGIHKMEMAWQKIFPDHPFEVEFIDEKISAFYWRERLTGQLAQLATAVAIIISCLGLFGLCAFIVTQRTKEIGIRKVLGASVESIVFLISKKFILLITLSFLIAAPIGYYLAGDWLLKFSFRISPGVTIFVLAWILPIIAAMLTIGLRTVKAAKTNPAEALRYE